MIGHGLWQSRLAGDPDVVGRTIRVGAVPRTVVGVMPPGFQYPIRDQLWMPVRFDPLAREFGSGPPGWVVGRLADGVSLEEAQNEIDLSGQRMAERFPDTHARLQPQVLPYTHAFTGIDASEARIGVAIGQALALLLLVLACGNVGILMLARAAARAGELALRTGLGASRTRIVSQLFIESLLLAMLAAGVGLLGLQAVATGPDYLDAGLPFWVDFEVSRRTAVLAISLAVVSAVVAGVIPALKATGRGAQASIQRASAGGSGIELGRGYSVLIVGESRGRALVPRHRLHDGPHDALRTRWARRPRGALPVCVPPASAGRRDAQDARRCAGATRYGRAGRERPGELVRRLSAEPDLGPIAVADALPGTTHATRYIQVEGLPRAEDAPAPAHLIRVARVDVGYLEALGQPVVQGRDFTVGDLGEDQSAVLVNQGFVERVLEGRYPLGRRLRYWTPGREPAHGRTRSWVSSGPWA